MKKQTKNKGFFKGYYPEIKLTVIKVISVGRWITFSKYLVKCDCGRQYEILHSGIKEKIKRETAYCSGCHATNQQRKTRTDSPKSVDNIYKIGEKLIIEYVDSHLKQPSTLVGSPYY